ncbi:LysR family transcriptional regulator [Azospirillum sp. A26]|uniref:LysR family transcriptional regulator n=1 Tax=Azospirillum sp. A26 TaxID=3160607 RepID=UPI00366E6145
MLSPDRDVFCPFKMSVDIGFDNQDKMGCRISFCGTMTRADLNDLDAVFAIARRGSFRAAALDLGMSTTALSNAVRKLEAELGVRLFNRTTRSVSLTDAGRLFVEQVGPALQDVHGALEAVRSQQTTPSGTLRINAFAMAAREILSPLVLEFLRRNPQVHVDLVTEGRLVDIVAEGFDLGVRVADLVPSDMIAVSLGRPQRYAVVGSPSYFEGHEKPRVPPDLLNHPCIRVRLPNGALYRWQFEKDGQATQIDVRGPITLDEASLARTAVLEGIGLGFFMEQDVRGDIEAGRLVRVLDGWTPVRAGLCLYYPGRRNPSAALRAFIGLARELGAKPGASP